MNKQQYAEYLRSDHWREVREIKLRSANFICELCDGRVGDGRLDVHHLSYERLGHEMESDLQVLCRPCHKRVHSAWYKPKNKGTGEEEGGFTYAWETFARFHEFQERARTQGWKRD